MMTKLEALSMLSDSENLQTSIREAADKVGITYQAVAQWPDVLTASIEDRVVAAWFRQNQRKAIDTLLAGAQAKKVAAIEAALPVPAAAITTHVLATTGRAKKKAPTPAVEAGTVAAAPPEAVASNNVANPFRA
jgi:hypothetical protein